MFVIQHPLSLQHILQIPSDVLLRLVGVYHHFYLSRKLELAVIPATTGLRDIDV